MFTVQSAEFKSGHGFSDEKIQLIAGVMRRAGVRTLWKVVHIVGLDDGSPP